MLQKQNFFKNKMVNVMTHEYTGTRGKQASIPNDVPFSHAILFPKAGFRGLYAPVYIPQMALSINQLSKFSYMDLAKFILKLYGVDVPDEVVHNSLLRYESFDDPSNPVPVVKLKEGIYVAEQYHGPTRAFKDEALQPFPYLLSYFAELYGKHYVIVVVTSGDTGPAALDGFKDLPNVKIMCYYPKDGASFVQGEQMRKAKGSNTKSIGVGSDFDGLQRQLKEMINSETFVAELASRNYEMSVANSVNFGRIVFQVIYQFWIYIQMYKNGELKIGELVDYIIPSGNFGNALGAYYAKMMGLPIGKIILATNENNVLADFVNRGIYDLRDRKLRKTSSPAMDILISSNVERLLFHLFGAERTKELMEDLETHKCFTLDYSEMKFVQSIFTANYATETETLETIGYVYQEYGYLIDPHTANGFVVHDKIELSNKTVILSTAEWTKFPEVIAQVFRCESDFSSICSKLGVKLPDQIKNLADMEICHPDIIEIDDMKEALLKFIEE